MKTKSSPPFLLSSVLAAVLVVAVSTISTGIAVGQSLEARGIRGNSSGGEDYVAVKVFGIEAKGSKFVYVFDRSGSMEGASLVAAKQQLLESLKSLGDTQQFDIIFFNHRLSAFENANTAKRPKFATTSNKALAEQYVKGIKADGGTDRFAALRQALLLQPNVVFFLSDADKPMPAKELAEIARLNERAGAQICAIEFGKGEKAPEASSMAELAQANGGKYVYIDTEKLPK